MVTHTHTQLKFRGWKAVTSKTTTSLFIVVLAFTLLSLTSCSSVTEPDASIAQAPPNSHDNDKTRHNIADWTDAGVLHNAGLRLADDSLAANLSRFTSEEAYLNWSTDTLLRDFATTTIGLTTSEEASVRSEFWSNWPPELPTTKTECEAIFSNAVAANKISQREADFMDRWVDILWQITEYSDFEVTQDSIDSWKTDILNISWGESETTITPFLSIAYYSFDFWLNEGFDDTDPLYVGATTMRMLPTEPENNPCYVDWMEMLWALNNRRAWPWNWSEDQCALFGLLQSNGGNPYWDQ